MHKRYVASKRHTIQVYFDDYLYAPSPSSVAPVRSAPARGGMRCLCRRTRLFPSFSAVNTCSYPWSSGA